MINSVTITNSNGEEVTINLSDVEPETGLFISEIEGLGPVNADINITNFATQDGGRWNSSRANTRNIVMHVLFTYANSIEEVRLLTYKYFPIKKKITFHIETDNRIAEVDGYVESNEPDIFSQQEEAVISILCESAWFKDVSDGGIQIINFSDIVSEFEFEFEDLQDETPSIIFSSIELKRENVITYKGETDSGIILSMFILNEGVVDPIIYNNETGESMKISTSKIKTIVGSEVTAGDEVRINTYKNEKSITFIRNGVSYNILNALEKDADWFQIHAGDNIFSYTATSGELDIEFQITTQILLQGV